MLKLNIGCGKSALEGWENLDNSFSVLLARVSLIYRFLRFFGVLNIQQIENIEWNRENQIKYMDASRRLPYDSGTVEVVYTSHMVEHLSRDDAKFFLQEVARVLKPSGILRIVVPDLKKLAVDYLSHGDGDLFVTKSHLAITKPKGVIQRIGFLLFGFRHHQWMYDVQSLTRLLNAVGFDDVTSLTAGKTLINHPGGLNLFERADESIYIEVIK